MRAQCVSLSLVLLASGSAHANESVTLAESEFTKQYLLAEPRLQATAADVAETQAHLSTARRVANPELEFERESVAEQSEHFVGIAWPLDLGGRGSRIQSARSHVQAAKHLASHTRWALTMDALGHYYDVLYAQEQLVLRRSARQPLVDVVELLRSQTSAGEGAGYDLDRLELALILYDEELAQAISDLQAAQASLAKLIGAPLAVVTVTGSLEVADPKPLSSLLRQGSSQRLDLRAAQARTLAEKQAVAAAERWWVPAAELSGGLKTVSAGGETRSGYLASIKLEIPLFDRNQAARKSASAAYQRERASLRMVSNSVQASIRRAHMGLTASLGRLRTLEDKQLRLAEGLGERAWLLLKEGEGTVIGFLDAQRTALQVRQRRLELQHQAKRMQLELWKHLGAPKNGGNR